MYQKEIISELEQITIQNGATLLEEQACQELINQIKKYQHKEKLCYCCNTQQESKDKIHKYRIKGRRYGSIFEGDNIEIHLCDKCKEKIKEEWFNEKPKFIDKYSEEYQYEEEIQSFINKFIPENQEYIYSLDNNNYKDYTDDEYAKELRREENNNYFNIYMNAFKSNS